MLTGFRFLELNQNLNTLVKTLQTDVEIRRPYTFLSRLPIVDSENDEIFGEYSGQVHTADIIADDQEAVIYEAGSIETFRAGQIPKIKMGARVGESMIRRLASLSDAVVIGDGDADLITGWENRLARQLVRGVRSRMNVLACAMMLNDVSYDRLGIQIDGTWGTPAELQVVLAGADRWSTDGGTTANAAATPIADIRAILDTASTLGQAYDRITIARKTFNLISQTTEFADNATFLYRYDVTGSLDVANTENMMKLFQAMTGLVVELEDSTHKTRNTKGQTVVERVMPADKVLFSNSADDGNPDVMDFSNGTVIESVVAPLFNAAIREAGGLGEQRGPYSYYTGNQTLNPPDLSAWAVTQGWPRKHVPEATATLDVF